jgi:tyrosine-protein phosphatase SIW14
MPFVACTRTKIVSSAIAPILFFLLAASAQAQAVEPELPNFHQVDANLYRGGQPATGGLSRLKALGIRTIVNLRYEPDLVKAEEAEAKAAGIGYYNVPMRGLNRPTDAQVTHILGLIDDPANRPVFVHCKAGSDRTGAIVACYRIARAEWTAEKAIREAFDYGMMRIEYAKRAFVRSFYAKLRKTGEALATARAAS